MGFQNINIYIYIFTTRDIDFNKGLKGPGFQIDYKANWQGKETKLELDDDHPELKRQTVSYRIAVTKTPILEPPHTAPNANEETQEKSITPNWHPIDRLISHYSSWHHLRKAVAWLLTKVKQRLRSKDLDGCKQLTIGDLQLSEQEIRHGQLNLRKLVDGMNKGSSIGRTNPYMDSQGVMRVGGPPARRNAECSGHCA